VHVRAQEPAQVDADASSTIAAALLHHRQRCQPGLPLQFRRQMQRRGTDQKQAGWLLGSPRVQRRRLMPRN
jgi:hypothetical protein